MDHILALECTRCGSRYEPVGQHQVCANHESGTGSLDVVLTEDVRNSESLQADTVRSLWDFEDLLPIPASADPVTLGEGGTPHVPAPALSERYDVECSLKLEGGNPTGSIKDRGTAAVATWARDRGATGLACASTGNAAASLGAYATRAGLDCLVFVPADVPGAKAVQPLVAGAEVIAVEGSYGEAAALCRQVTSRSGWVTRSAGATPAVRAGMGTIGYELVAQQPETPEWVVVPMGNGGAIAGLWSGLSALAAAGALDDPPQLLGVQAEGTTPIADAFEGEERFDTAETIADSIAVSEPDASEDACRSLSQSTGDVVVVSDDDIQTAQQELGSAEGVFAEPASAATLAGLSRARKDHIIPAGASVSLLVTGTGLKDKGAAQAAAPTRKRLSTELSDEDLFDRLDVFE